MLESYAKHNDRKKTTMNTWRRVALILIVLADAGLLAWGALAAGAPERLPGPGSTLILPAEFEGFTGHSWSELTSASPLTAEFITILFRVYGAYIVAFGVLALAIAAMEGMVRDMKANVAEMRAAASNAYATATDLADWLVQNLGLPFREAHHVTGKIVALAERKKLPLDKLALADLQAVHAAIDKRAFKVLTVEHSVAQRASLGGTAPANVKREATRWLKQLKGRRS